MDENKIHELKNKVVDFKRFAFILLAISGFLSIGLLLPTDALASTEPLYVIGFIFFLLIASFLFHRSAMSVQRKIYEEDVKSQ